MFSIPKKLPGCLSQLADNMPKLKPPRPNKKNIADIAASYQFAIIDVLIKKLKYAAEYTRCKNCVVAGGVAANKFLRQYSKEHIPSCNIIYPHPSFCTDNAAMIAYLGEKYLLTGKTSKLNFSILPNMKID